MALSGKRNRLVCGVGFNDSSEKVTYFDISTGKRASCPYYSRWRKMLERCYSVSTLNRRPSYRECTVCEEWLKFSNFKVWMEKQDWEGKELDKDILGDGKTYSAESCIFIPQEINSFLSFTKRDNTSGYTGVAYNKKDKRFIAAIRNPATKRRIEVGRCSTAEEAAALWVNKKISYVDYLVDHYNLSDEIKSGIIKVILANKTRLEERLTFEVY